MNKLTKTAIVAALFSLSLTACEKIENATQKPAQTQAQHTEQSDFQTFLTWNKTQTPSLNQAQEVFKQSLEQAREEKSAEKAQDAVNVYVQSVEQAVAALDKLDIQVDSVKSLKDNTKAALLLSIEVLKEQIQSSQAKPSENAKATLNDKLAKLVELMAQVEKENDALAAKYAPKPAENAAPESNSDAK